jgi:hypothetical protein
VQSNTKRNEHPACSCAACRRGKRSNGGKWLLNQINKKIRRLAKQHLKRGDEDAIIISTPYTD